MQDIRDAEQAWKKRKQECLWGIERLIQGLCEYGGIPGDRIVCLQRDKGGDFYTPDAMCGVRDVIEYDDDADEWTLGISVYLGERGAHVRQIALVLSISEKDGKFTVTVNRNYMNPVTADPHIQEERNRVSEEIFTVMRKAASKASDL